MGAGSSHYGPHVVLPSGQVLSYPCAVTVDSVLSEYPGHHVSSLQAVKENRVTHVPTGSVLSPGCYYVLRQSRRARTDENCRAFASGEIEETDGLGAQPPRMNCMTLLGGRRSSRRRMDADSPVTWLKDSQVLSLMNHSLQTPALLSRQTSAAHSIDSEIAFDDILRSENSSWGSSVEDNPAIDDSACVKWRKMAEEAPPVLPVIDSLQGWTDIPTSMRSPFLEPLFGDEDSEATGRRENNAGGDGEEVGGADDVAIPDVNLRFCASSVSRLACMPRQHGMLHQPEEDSQHCGRVETDASGDVTPLEYVRGKEFYSSIIRKMKKWRPGLENICEEVESFASSMPSSRQRVGGLAKTRYLAQKSCGLRRKRESADSLL